jgi:predicted ATPase
MIKEIKIDNYKSIQQLHLDFGRFNVFIGANGSGKSNLLEAIAFAGAAATQQLEPQQLRARGIRVSEPTFMKSAFSPKNHQSKEVNLRIQLAGEQAVSFQLEQEGANGWKDRLSQDHYLAEIDKAVVQHDSQLIEQIKNLRSQQEAKKRVGEFLKKFVIYSPENSSLRNFHSEYQIEPLGVRGEGLFALISQYSAHQESGKWEELLEAMTLFDWFDSFEVRTYGADARQLLVKDLFTDQEMGAFDHHSVNEGFLYVLFYFALFISDKTSPCFAIDNLETALNPKLAKELVERLFELSQTYQKQVFISTHSPIMLDALHLENEEVRLFVVSRNLDGQTIIQRIREKQPVGNDSTAIKLSEAWQRGYLGGLPDNF